MGKALSLFARRLGIFIAEKGLSQAALAKQVDMKPQQLNKYATGQTPPGLEVIEKIASALGHPIADFFSENITLSGNDELLRLWSQADESDRELVLSILKGDEEIPKSKSKRGPGGA